MLFCCWARPPLGRKDKWPFRSPSLHTKALNANHSSTVPGSDDVRPPLPTVVVTGVPSANSGHYSPVLWRHCGNLRRSARRARHCSSYYAANSPYLFRTFPSAEPPNGMGTTLGSDSGLDQDKTLDCRTLGTPPRRPLELPGRRRDLRKTKDDAQDDSHARRHTPQCTSHSARPLHPHDSGKRRRLS